MEKKSTTILIVDDDANLASNLQDILEAEGYAVEVAQSGETALNLCREKLFDLGLIDIKLPDIPGMELVGKIAVLLPSVEYIIMTGYASVETAIEAVERRDILAYVTKPLNMDHLLSLIRQVVERRRAELELEAKERYFRSLIHNMHEDIVVIDRNYRITDVNNTLMVTTGLRRDEVIGRQCFEILHNYEGPCETHGGQCKLKEVFKTGRSCNCRHEHRREDASATYVDILLSPLKDQEGKVTHVIEATRDISDLVKSQEALKASERGYRRLFEAAKDGILILDAESGIVEDINPYLLDLLGYSKPEILGKHLWDLGLFKDKLRSQNSFRELQEKGYVHYEDLPLETKDGLSVDVESVSNAYMVDNERVIQCNIRDITERKRLEEKTARLALFPELNPNPVLELDAEGNIKYLNPATKRMFPDLEALGLNHPLLEDWEELIAELGEGGWLKPIIRDKNIGDSYYVTVVYPIAGAQSMHLYVRDITARKKAEVELLRVSEVLHSIRNVNQLITREKDRGRLLKGVCKSLVEGRGFLSAWIGVLDSAQKLVLSSEAGIGEDLQVLLRCLETGKLPGCALQALTQGQTVLIKDAGREVCDKCALPKHVGGHTVICARLEHQGRIYGVVHASIAPVIDVGKEEIGLFQEVTQDIALALHDMELDEQHRQAVAALEASETRFRDFYDNAPVAYYSMSTDSFIIQANKETHLLLGYSAGELIYKHRSEIVSPECQAKSAAIFERFKSGTAIKDEEMVYLTKDGTKLYVLLSATPIRDGSGRIIASRSVIEDITERKQAEERLRQSEAKYAALVEKGNDGIVIIQDGLLKFSNQEMTRIIGFSPAEILGEPFIDSIAPGDISLVSERYQKRMAGEPVPSKYEARLLSRSGEEIPVEISASIIEYEGKPAEMAIVRDITERRRMEEQLIVTDRLASIGELAAGLAHEINNPLTGVIGFSQLLLGKELPDDARESVNIIHREAQRTAEIVKNLLTFARKHAPLKQTVNINEVIEKVLQLRAYEQRVNNIRVVTKLATNLPEIMADYFQLQQVFLNIIINAEYFMTEAHSGGTLTIGTSKDGQIVRASFADDGPGIAPQALGHIFDPFFTTKQVGKGTGLGLSICHGIVSEHGGKIYAENEQGKGATFIIDLPVSILDQP